MSKLTDVINIIQGTNGCKLLAACGLPQVKDGQQLPNDVIEFYSMYGGLSIFDNQDYSYGISIVGPEMLLPANNAMYGDEMLSSIPIDHETWDWYMIGIGKLNPVEKIAIDFSVRNNGICRDAFWDSYPTDSVIIAKSFTDLLSRLIENNGDHWYWYRPGYIPPV